MHGFSGAGKSALARAIVERMGVEWVRSDVERKQLHGLAALASSRNDGGPAIYDPASTLATYARLAELAEAIILSGRPAIIDATFLDRVYRDQFRDLAQRLDVPFAIIDIVALPGTLRQRITARAHAGDDPSEADLTVLAQQLARAQPLAPDELPQVLCYDAEVSLTSAAANLPNCPSLPTATAIMPSCTG